MAVARVVTMELLTVAQKVALWEHVMVDGWVAWKVVWKVDWKVFLLVVVLVVVMVVD